MSLTMMVYLIGMLPALSKFFIFGCLVSGAGLFMYLMFNCLEGHKLNNWLIGGLTTVCIISAFLNVLLPTEKTAYTMVAAYATQKVYESPETAKIQAKVLTIINQKLDTFIEKAE